MTLLYLKENHLVFLLVRGMQRIFDSIDQSNLSLLRDMKMDYNLLKYELGRVPMMMDFLNHGKRDPFSFVAYSKSYYQFVRKVDQNFAADLTSGEVGLLAAFSKEINNGRRVEDSIALEQIIENDSVTVVDVRMDIAANTSTQVEIVESIIGVESPFIKTEPAVRFKQTRSHLQAEIRLASPASVHAGIYGLDGSTIREFPERKLNSGEHKIQWPHSGLPVKFPVRIYFLKLEIYPENSSAPVSKLFRIFIH